MEDKRAAAIARGKRAELLLQDELLVESLDSLKAAYIEAWQVTSARDSDARERLWQAVQVVGKVKEHLGSIAANGRIAQTEIDDLAPPQKRGIFG